MAAINLITLGLTPEGNAGVGVNLVREGSSAAGAAHIEREVADPLAMNSNLWGDPV